MTLRTYIIRRVALSLFILWIVATINFAIFRDDPFAFYYLDWPYMDVTTKNMILQNWDANLLTRYVLYLQKMFSYGLAPPYFGWSKLDQQYIAYRIGQRLPITLFLIGTSLIGSIIIGTSLGMFAASKRGTRKDKAITASALFTWSTPVFVFQLLAVYVLSYLLIKHGIYILPLNSVLPSTTPTGLGFYLATVWHLILPIITLTLVGLGPWVLQTRNMLIDTLEQDFIITARAKGLSEGTVLRKHAFKTILPSVSTMITMAVPAVITGSIVTETIFGINGIGNYFCRAFMIEGQIVRVLDYSVIEAVFFIYATLAVVLNLIADLTYAVFDPRIRVGVSTKR